MHEARWSRAKDDADKRRTRGSIFRAAISSARNERTSRLWARAALFEHAAAPGQARAAPVEYSAAPGQARAAISSHLRPRAGLERPFRTICGSGPSSSGHIFEPSAAPGRARAAISSHLRLRAKLERPYAANSGISRGQAGYEALKRVRGRDPKQTL